MSTTTDILFNSPALHSLKRDQLVKLCKIHSIKANGKNVDLIQRLRLHASTLPKDSPLSIAARSEPVGPIPTQPKFTDDDDAPKYLSPEEENSFHVKSRPSEQWEVLDSIVEEDEDSQGTLRSQRTLINQNAGEFGTGGSKSSTVSSSIKALATSLGLKRSVMKASTSSKTALCEEIKPVDDELGEISMPYGSLPESTSPPQTDHFTFESSRVSLGNDSDVPLPGHDLRPGMPAPANARLSMGLAPPPATPSRVNQPTTTIRLISNPLSRNDTFTTSGENGTPQLKPFNTDFDITFGSPIPGGLPVFGFGSLSSWPPKVDNDVVMRGIYPSLNSDDLTPPAASSAATGDDDVLMPGAIQPSPPSQPFMFGSPQTTKQKFDLTSFMSEVNQNFRESGVDELGSGIIDRLHPDLQTQRDIGARPMKPMPGQKKPGVSNKFDKLHEQEFSKMEGIDGTFKRKAQRLAAKSAEASGSAQQLTVPDAERVVGKKRKSMVEDESIQGKGPRRPSVAPNRGTTTRVISNGRRAKVLPGAFGPDDDDDEVEDEDAARGEKRVKMDPEAVPVSKELTEAEKEKEAAQKQINAIRARRRSSVVNGPRKSGRTSMGRPRQSIVKPKPSRFGFLASAKSMVSNVWNRGKTPVAPSNIPKAAPTPKPEPPKPKVPSLLTKKAAAAPAKPTVAVATGARISSTKVNDPKKLSSTTANASLKGSVASSSRSRSPLPSFSPPPGSDGLQSNTGSRTSRLGATTSSRVSSIAGTATSRTSSGGVSSIGTKASGKSRISTALGVGSMGTKASATARTSTTGSASRMSTSSRLFAPTASSLAKAAHRPSITSVMKSSVTEETPPPPSRTLSPLTNSFATADTTSPQSGKIFSKPLLLPQRSGIPTPMRQRPTSPLSPPAVAEDGSRAKPAGGVSDTGSGASTASRSLNGRKPRISRSKVIAKLASQRSTSGSSIASTASGKSVLGPRRSGLAPRASGGLAPIGANGGRTRSSLGVKAARASYGGVKSRGSAGGPNAVMLSAKKRTARQSELEKRRSRMHMAPQPDFGSPFAGDRTGSDAMDCDA